MLDTSDPSRFRSSQTAEPDFDPSVDLPLAERCATDDRTRHGRRWTIVLDRAANKEQHDVEEELIHLDPYQDSSLGRAIGEERTIGPVPANMSLPPLAHIRSSHIGFTPSTNKWKFVSSSM